MVDIDELGPSLSSVSHKNIPIESHVNGSAHCGSDLDISPKTPETKKRHLEEKPHQYPKAPACADCKRLKVRCVRSDPNNMHSDCLRCIKKQLVCVTGIHSKRLKSSERSQSSFFEEARKQRSSQQERIRLAPIGCRSMRDQLLSTWKQLTTRDDTRLQLLEKFEFTTLAKPINNVMKRGLLNYEQITQRLQFYRDQIYPKYPVVACPDIEDFEKSMNETPVLFHTILDISSLVVQDESQKEVSLILHNMVLRTVIDEIMVVSIKNFELLQCLVLLTQWYNESELYHQQRLHVLTTLALSVSYDLGMGGVTIARPGSKAPPFEQMVAPQTATDVHTTESYKIWIAVYNTLFQTLTANRRPIKCHWNRYTEMAVSHLKNISINLRQPQGDFEIWEVAQLRHLQERVVHEIFKKDNEPMVPDLTDPKTQSLIENLDAEIDKLTSPLIVPSIRRRVAQAGIRIFLHQSVLYTPFLESIGRAPFTNFSLNLQSGPLNSRAVHSYRKLVQNTKMILDICANSQLSAIASEISTFWTGLTLACDILLKCRSCTIFNRYFAGAYFVTDSDIKRITKVTNLFDRVVKEYPNCNSALSFGFFINLLICHHDARVHYHSTRLRSDLFGDPHFVMQLSNTAQNCKEGNDPSNDESLLAPVNGMQSSTIFDKPVEPNQANGINFQMNGMTSNGLVPTPVDNNLECMLMNEQMNRDLVQEMNANQYAKFKDYNAPIAFNNMAGSMNGSMNGSDNLMNVIETNGISKYIPVQYADSSSRKEQNQLSSEQPQISNSKFSESQIPLFDNESLDYDVAALSNIEAFWNDVINQTGDGGPFGYDFPV